MDQIHNDYWSITLNIDGYVILIYSKLRSEGVKVHPAAAGYYIFPDFSILRDKLAARGITTGQHMCDAILDEANVSVSESLLLTSEIQNSLLIQSVSG